MLTQVHAYVLAKDTCTGNATANPDLGAGEATQYIIDNRDKANLVGRIMGYAK